MKKCNKCGKENLDEFYFCSQCGTKLGAVSSSSKDTNSSSKSSSSGSKDANSNSKSSSSGSKDTNSGSKSSNSRWSLRSFLSNLLQYNKSFYNKDKVCYVCCFIPMILFVMFQTGVNYNHLMMAWYTEDYETNYPEEFNSLDLNNDSKLDFYEVDGIVSHTPEDTLYDLFLKSDKNNNGYLIGFEYDIYRLKAHGNSYEEEYKKSLQERENDSKSSSSSSYHSQKNKNSNSLNDYEYDSGEGYVLTCPYCGSEAIYETGGAYMCAECGSYIYSPDDMETGYWDGYME